MAQQLQTLESRFNDIFVKKAPALPEKAQSVIVQIAPWLALAAGIFFLIVSLSLWQWAHDAANLAKYANEICATYQGPNCAVSATRLSLSVWFALIAGLGEGLLYLFAFQGLKEHRKKGWNYVWYGALLNLVYGVFSLFTSFSPLTSFIGAMIGSAIGFYFLFQVRSFYAEAPVKVISLSDQQVAETEPTVKAEVAKPKKTTSKPAKKTSKKSTQTKKAAKKKTTSTKRKTKPKSKSNK